MQAIFCKYVPATDRRPSRVKATAGGTGNGISITVPYDDELSGDAAFWPAAEALARKLGWSGTMCAGSIQGGTVFVFTDNGKFFVEED